MVIRDVKCRWCDWSYPLAVPRAWAKLRGHVTTVHYREWKAQFRG